MTQVSFLALRETTPQAQALFDEDIAEHGYVMNHVRTWAYQPDVLIGLFDLMRRLPSSRP